MDTRHVIELENEYVLQTYARPPFVIERGEGVWLYDSEGHKYLDLVAGIAVNALGYGDPQIQATIQEQAGQLIHISNLYYSAPMAELAERLVIHSFADRAFFCNSGAEANEGAFKFARKYAFTAHPELPDKNEIVAFKNAFHGRLMGTLAATPREKYQAGFRPLMPGVCIAEFNNLGSAKEAIGPNTAAVILEPVQGEGGIHIATQAFMDEVRRLCDQYDAALIFDEVQCGMGRTGTLWAHEAYGVTPDIMTLAKPLGGGLPIGAVLLTRRIADVLHPGDHGTTFGANPLICAVANQVFDRINQPQFLATVRENGEYLQERLTEINSPHIKEVRGRGLMVGVELDISAGNLVRAGYAHGLILVNAGENVLRLIPPLIITKPEIDIAVEGIASILASV